jgi:Carboxypeptidase regulatory-like domain
MRATVLILLGAAALGAIAWLLLGDRDVDRPVRAPEVPAPGGVEAPLEETSASRPAVAKVINPAPYDDAGAPAFPGAETRFAGAGIENASVDVRVLWGDDRTPAAGILVRVHEWGARSGMMKTRDVTAGADGTFRLTDVVPGRVSFFIDRGGGKSVHAPPGSDQEVVLEVPAGPNVAGTVVERGQPFAGAEVWLSQYGNGREGMVVAKSDAGGAFKLRAVGRMHWLAARAPGHAPSPAVGIYEGGPGETVSIRLVLGGPGGALRCAVTGADGAAAPGATVRVTSNENAVPRQGNDYPPPPAVAVTDAAGVALVEGLAPGMNKVAVRVAGRAPWGGDVDVRPGETARLDVRLPSEVVITGTVRLPTGAPAAGAIVSVGNWGEFLSSVETTGADGSYRLGGVAPGKVEIRANARDVGRAAATLDCPEGAEVRWDAVLESGARIVGFVRDEADRPLAGYLVNARESGGSPANWLGQSITDANGRFNITNCPEGKTFDVEAYDRTALGGTGTRAQLLDVKPGDYEHLIRITTQSSGEVRGRIVDSSGAPALATVRLDQAPDPKRLNWRPMSVESDGKTGAFSAKVLAGRYWVSVQIRPLGRVDLEWKDVAGGAVLDLGDIRLPAPGTLLVELAAAEPLASAVTYEISASASSQNGAPFWMPPYSSAARDLPRPLSLGPGPYSLRIKGQGVEPQSKSFVIRSGEETVVSVTPIASAPK